MMHYLLLHFEEADTFHWPMVFNHYFIIIPVTENRVHCVTRGIQEQTDDQSPAWQPQRSHNHHISYATILLPN